MTQGSPDTRRSTVGWISAGFLWLFVINLGIAFGAGIYEARVVIPQWADIPPQQWPNTGLMFWAYVTTGPLTLLTLANAFLAWHERGRQRPWWIAAVAITVLERIATFGYFIPAMVGMTTTPDVSQAEVAAALDRWLLLNHGRHVLSFSAWMAALKALSLGGHSRG